ncbi:MAG: c-type cytochrome [Vulcanimicrobiaceae bacterium]
MKEFGRVAAVGMVLAVSLVACAKGTSQSSSASSTAGPAASPMAATSAAPVSAATSTTVASTGGVSAALGAKVFSTNCSSCHGATGKGMPGVFPPLAGNPAVNGPAAHVIHIVKYGLHGKLMVKGKTYNGTMPVWGKTLSVSDIASVVTYIRASWGNKASAVTVAQVKAVKR